MQLVVNSFYFEWLATERTYLLTATALIQQTLFMDPNQTEF